MILRSPLLRIHYYQNKQLQIKESQYLIPTYSWTLTPIPNWTCSVVTISHFQCTTPSTWLTNRCADPSMLLDHQFEKDVGCKILLFITRWRSWSCLVTKPFGVQTQQLLQEKEELGKTMLLITLFFTLVELCSYATASPLTAFKIILICLGLWEKKVQTYIHGLDENQLWKTELHKSQQIPYLSSSCWTSGWNSSFKPR